jgi:hypothetical protein
VKKGAKLVAFTLGAVYVLMQVSRLVGRSSTRGSGWSTFINLFGIRIMTQETPADY